ncbi:MULTISPECIES: hypothetical protein [Aerosakkonema]|uniref:hypothetical protein n=1 Tax=Aerosakkonema TaxID=1246629 RepID=UPI0035B94C72
MKKIICGFVWFLSFMFGFYEASVFLIEANTNEEFLKDNVETVSILLCASALGSSVIAIAGTMAGILPGTSSKK